MILASHNTWTYLRPQRWYMRLFQPVARCQSNTLVEQFENGSRLFDLRVRFRRGGTPYICHGLCRYDEDVSFLLMQLDQLAEHCEEPVYCRVMFEDNLFTSNIDMQEKYFWGFCHLLANDCSYRHIKFFGGWCKRYWRDNVIFHNFKEKEPLYVEKHASVSGKGLLKFLPREYAMLHNSDNRADMMQDVTCKYFMMDFV